MGIRWGEDHSPANPIASFASAHPWVPCAARTVVTQSRGGMPASFELIPCRDAHDEQRSGREQHPDSDQRQAKHNPNRNSRYTTRMLSASWKGVVVVNRSGRSRHVIVPRGAAAAQAGASHSPRARGRSHRRRSPSRPSTRCGELIGRAPDLAQQSCAPPRREEAATQSPRIDSSRTTPTRGRMAGVPQRLHEARQKEIAK